MSKRSKRRQSKKLQLLAKEEGQKIDSPVEHVSKRDNRNSFQRIYEDKYKLLLIIPIILLGLALVQIIAQTAITGDFISKDVSLKGGITITVPTQADIDTAPLADKVLKAFPGTDVSVRALSSLGETVGITIESDIGHDDRDTFINLIAASTGVDRESLSIEEIGSSLGQSFFRQTMIAILIAFVFMGIVVFFYFRTIVPSLAVILAAFSDIVVTVAIVNLLSIKVSTAGIAAFLMLIGYSVDTDILLSTKVLKRTEGTVTARIYDAMKTGLTMNVTTLVAVTVGLLISNSDVLTQIMTIIFIGLLIDIINTWIQNVGILKLYLEKKNVKD